MSDFSARRTLTLTATIATSVAAAAGMIAPAAHATPASPDGAAKLTLAGSTAVQVVGGSAIAVAGQNQLGANWAPDGSRFTYVDSADNNAVYVQAPGQPRVLVAPGTGVTRSTPTWINGGADVLWAEHSAGTTAFALKAGAANGLDLDKNNVPIVRAFTVPTLDGAGSIETPDAVDKGGSDLVAVKFIPTGQPVTASEIWVYDTTPGAAKPVYKVAQGGAFQPSVSSDGKNIAFLQNTANIDQIYTVSAGDPGAAPAAPTAVTAQPAANPHSFSHPVWNPDGKSIVFQWLDGSGADIDTQSVNVGGAAAAAPYTQITPGTAVTGFPAFQPQKKNAVLRLAGNDRLDTAVKVSASHWKTAGSTTSTGAQAKAVVLSRSDQPADALGGAALAAKVGGPLLLTQTAGLNGAASAEIQRVLGPGDGVKTVYVLGGTAALSPAVETALNALHYKVQRVAGADRYTTAVEIAKTITGGAAPDTILVATGQNYADALSAGAAAGAINAHDGKNAVVVLTNDKTMPQATIDYIGPLNGRTVLNSDGTRPANYIRLTSIGGQAEYALSHPWIPPQYVSGAFSALTGATRYETSVLVARTFFGGAHTAGVSTGLNWADALSGGALMGTLDGPMLLIPPAGPTGTTSTFLTQSSGQFDLAVIFGGNGAVGATADPAVGTMIGGPAGVDYPAWNPSVG